MAKDLQFVAPDLRAFALRMKHAGNGKEVIRDFRKIHRKFAGKIRDDIKNQMPKTGGIGGKNLRSRIGAAHARSGWKKTGSRHDTPRGSMSRSVKLRASSYASSVEGGNDSVPHYVVNEFGGAVWWRSRTRHAGMGSGWARDARGGHKKYAAKRAMHGNVGHIIPVRPRSPQRGRGAEGWVFYPVFYDTMPKIEDAYTRALNDVIRKNVAKTKYNFF